MTEPASIRARMHESALKRVTRSFSASLADIFSETLQNARRAGAGVVHVSLRDRADGALEIEIADSGEGIRDPAVLLSFGQNGWDEKLVQREDAAGMGMLSLARRGCVVTSRPLDSGAPGLPPGWRVALQPEHFLGETAAEVKPCDEAPAPSGTSIRFLAETHENAHAVRQAIESAARYYPLRVVFNHPPYTPPEGETLPRRAFLDGAVHVERWRGLVFGVFKDRAHRFGLYDPDLNFHGLTLALRLPAADTVNGSSWQVAADVENCPELELVLPARKEAVETPFLRDMREAAQLAIYRAMAAETDPRPSFTEWRRAREAGIEIPPPSPLLAPWMPDIADIEDWRMPPDPEALPENALIAAFDSDPPRAQAFWRAAHRNGLAKRLLEGDRRLEGFGWYDAIPRIVSVETEIQGDGRRCMLERYADRPHGAKPLEQRPALIHMRASVASADGAAPPIDLSADLAFAGEVCSWVGDALPLVTPDSDLDPCALADLLQAAYYSPSDDAEADSWDRQKSDFQQEASLIATRLLVSDDAARRGAIAGAVWRELYWLLPKGRDVDIAVRGRDVTVTFGPPREEESP